MVTIYLSLVHAGSCGYLFHEIPGIKKKIVVLVAEKKCPFYDSGTTTQFLSPQRRRQGGLGPCPPPWILKKKIKRLAKREEREKD